ncbi:MAG: hydrogen gas-evolving membrane-bound hydrogenase subunit E [Planctomycetota bacterium]
MIHAALFILFGVAVLAVPLCRLLPRLGPLVIAAIPLVLGCWFATMLPAVGAGEVIVAPMNWLAALDIDLGLRLDGLSLMFALLICFIGSLVLLYASAYLSYEQGLGRFMGMLIGFMGAMLGLVLADNLIVLFVFWELTSVLSFVLIGFEYKRDAARNAALQALLVTGLGGLALLAGLILLGIAAGGYTMSAVFAADITGHALYPAALVLVLLGAFTKSAIWPFHFWLPNAMEAPSPVSARRHSATMVKAGVYIIARLHPAMSGPVMWDDTLALFGGGTMLLAAINAARQTQLKKILAYSTISSLGTLVMLIGLGASKAAAAYLIAHGLFKGCLFLVAGAMTKHTGLKDPDRISGLLRTAPVLATAGIIGGLSMAGMFPLIGFVGKELLLKAGLHHPEWAVPATVAAALAGTLTVMAAVMVAMRPALAKASEGDLDSRKRLDPRLLVGPVVLALGGVVAGLAPTLFAEPLVGAVRMSIDGGELPEKTELRWLKLLWPATLATYLSIAALIVGTLLFFARGHYRRGLAFVDRIGPLLPERLYNSSVAGVLWLAGFVTAILQNGSLQSYVRVTLGVTFAVCAFAFARAGMGNAVDVVLSDVTLIDIVLLLAIVVGAVAAVFQKTALASVAAMGATGFALALVYGLYGAPDVATTQFAVETLIVIIFVLVIFHLPKYLSVSPFWRRAADGVLALLFGGLMTAFAIRVLGGPGPETISSFYAERSYEEAYGRNVVNVILVDFRALDTLGEVFVIGIAAIGVYTLLRLRAPKPEAAS